MRELTKEEIHQVLAGTTPPAPAAAIPTNFNTAGSTPPPIGIGLGNLWSLPPLAERDRP